MAIRDPGVLDRQKYHLHPKTLPQIPTGIFFRNIEVQKSSTQTLVMNR